MTGAAFAQARYTRRSPLDLAVVPLPSWDANQNIPQLVSGIGQPGDEYIVSVGATRALDGNTQWLVNDIVIFIARQSGQGFWLRIPAVS
jgi:hypothetical protein